MHCSGQSARTWTLRYSVNGKQKEESFRDDMDERKRVRYGTGYRKAQDAKLDLTRGEAGRGTDLQRADRRQGQLR
jgi:hypothetical protein